MQLGRVGFAHGTQFAAVVYDDGVNSANSVVPLIRNEYSHYVKYDAICDPELYVGYYPDRWISVRRHRSVFLSC